MSEVVKQHYNDNAIREWMRLMNPYSIVEFKSTLYLIDKYFPKSGNLIDIGCGPGRYSIEMLKRGYKVTLSDLSNEELNIAKEEIEKEGLKAEKFICCSATELQDLQENYYDCILLMGPMYHLKNKEDRKKTLKNVYRALKQDGVALISYINFWGVIKAGITEAPDWYTDINNVYSAFDEHDFNKDECFTEAYFTIPPKAIEEVEGAGFRVISYAGAESFVSGTHTELTNMHENHREAYENILKVAAETCELPQYRDATEHLNIVVRK